jgi:hypothetical protein
VTEVVAGVDTMLIGLEIVGTPAASDASGRAERSQVLTVRDGQVADIRGYDDRHEAAIRAGLDT